MEKNLTRLYFTFETVIQAEWEMKNNLNIFRETKKQLSKYFKGILTSFKLPLLMKGTQFQRKVWFELEKIPYGVTISYKELAYRVGNPAASRAVGLANNRNPIPIIIPCHRVIGTNGKLVGYGGGIDRKKWLLKLEQATIKNSSRKNKS